jgi:hypothetical protein
MLNDSKKVKEKRHFDLFKKLCTSLPDGSVEHDDKPDFLIYEGSKITGIEHTGLYLPIRKGYANPKEVFVAQNNILRRCRENAIKYNLPIAYVQIHFAWSNIPYDIEKTVKNIIQFTTPILKDLAYDQIIKSKINPIEGILRIRIKSPRYHGLWWCDSHRWERINVYTKAIDPIHKVQETIDKKNKIYKDYIRKCSECWLLIAFDGFNYPEAFHFTEAFKDNIFYSLFNKIYLLDANNMKLIELKIT